MLPAFVKGRLMLGGNIELASNKLIELKFFQLFMITIIAGSLFENYIDDTNTIEVTYGVIRVHPANQLLREKFKPGDLVVITHQDKQIVCLLRFDMDIPGFTKKSIYIHQQQRYNLALPGREEKFIHLEIKKGNFVDALHYFFDSLFH